MLEVGNWRLGVDGFVVCRGGLMITRISKASALGTSFVVLVALSVPVLAHHSFAMYDQTKTVTLTGVIKQFVPQANHAEIHFMLLADDHKSLKKGPDGKYVEWGV